MTGRPREKRALFPRYDERSTSLRGRRQTQGALRNPERIGRSEDHSSQRSPEWMSTLILASRLIDCSDPLAFFAPLGQMLEANFSTSSSRGQSMMDGDEY